MFTHKNLKQSIHNLIVCSDLINGLKPEQLEMLFKENKYEFEQLKKFTDTLKQNIKLLK